MSASRARRLFHPWLIYGGLAVLLTWPLATHFTTHVAGDGIDDPSLAWNLWWIKSRLLDQLRFDIFHADWMFHPIGINLAFYTLTPLNGLLSIPLQTALSLIVANNLLLLSSFVLGGFGMYLLARQELSNTPFTIYLAFTRARNERNLHLAALFAGMVYAFAASKLFYAGLGQFNIASSHWIPFCALYTLRLARSTSRGNGIRNALLAGLFLTFQAWAELTYASFLLIFIALVFCWSFWRRQPITDDRRSVSTRNTQHAIRFTAFLLLGLVFLLGIAPFLWAMLPDLRVEGDFFASGGGFADDYSADLLGYLLPTQRHPLLGSWVDLLPFPHDKGQQIFIGYSVLLLSVLGALAWLRHKATRLWGRFWLIATLFFWWMTLGAQLRWNGEPLPIPGPFALISQLPFFSGNRYPSRYSVMLLMGVAILAGAGILFLLSRISPSRISPSRISPSRISPSRISPSRIFLPLTFTALFLFEHLAVPMPLSDFRVPGIYARLAAEPGDFTVLELPTGWRNGARVMGKSDILIMMQQWYQAAHGKRRLGGNTSRNPAYKFDYFTNAPLLGELIALMNATPNEDDPAQNELFRVINTEFDALVERNRVLAPTVLDFLDVRYLLLHRDKTPLLLQRFVDAALPVTLVDRWEGTDWRGTPATIDLYKVTARPAQTQWSIDLVAAESTLYLAEGWSTLPWQGVRYSTRPCATLLLDLPSKAGQLTVQLAEGITVTSATINGDATQSVPTSTPATVTIAFAANQVAAAVDRLTLCTDERKLLTALGTPPTAQGWPIGETGATIAANLFVRSAGNDVGNFAQIQRAGESVMTTARGYNLAAFEQRGTILATATFDTLLSTAASDALADWIAALPTNTIVAGAVMDEASYALNERAVQALATLGLTGDLRERFRWSHAFVGVKGAAPGSAVEATSLLYPATVAVGIGIDAPAVYVGVRAVDYQMAE